MSEELSEHQLFGLTHLGRNGASVGAVESFSSKDESPPEDSNKDIKVPRKRKFKPKLTAEILLSDKGLPKIQKILSRMKFKGKGHEAEDISKLMRTYRS